MLTFKKDFTLQEPIPQEGIDLALGVLQTGRIHRYNTIPGEKSYANQLEEAFAKYMGRKYCLSAASCGSTMYLALKSVGVQPGDKVLCNAFTLAPVPGAIQNSGAEIVLVEITEDYTIDLADLEKKAQESKAKYLLISHMRGHLVDMEKVTAICEKYGITMIEDCAHTMGATWNGKKSGNFGHVACFSTQTYKHMNSGEGGLLVTDDPEVIAKAIIYSGSYMLYEGHTLRPDMPAFEEIKYLTPNYSCRMDNLRAAILLPQLEILDKQCERWNVLYRHAEKGINAIDGFQCPHRPKEEYYVGSSIQFNIPNASYEQFKDFLAKTAERGVSIKWFGDSVPRGFTSAYTSWRYYEELENLELPNTLRILATMCDIRLPLTFNTEDIDIIVQIIKEIATELQL